MQLEITPLDSSQFVLDVKQETISIGSFLFLEEIKLIDAVDQAVDRLSRQIGIRRGILHIQAWILQLGPA